MSCGCGQNTSPTGSGSPSGSSAGPGGLDQQISAILEGRKKLNLLDALQMIAALATIVGFLKYLFGSK